MQRANENASERVYLLGRIKHLHVLLSFDMPRHRLIIQGILPLLCRRGGSRPLFDLDELEEVQRLIGNERIGINSKC